MRSVLNAAVAALLLAILAGCVPQAGGPGHPNLIIVREFAGALGLKPFKLISELMEMSIFASMNQSIVEAVATKVASRERHRNVFI